MDRKYKSENSVLVFRTHAYEEQEPGYEKPVGRFKQKPYSLHGMDYFKYKGVMYPAFWSHHTGIYILLNRPLNTSYPQ